MRKLIIACGLLLTASCLAAPVSAQMQSLGVRIPAESQVNGIGLTRAWWAHSVTNPLRDKLLHFVLDADNLYVQSSNGAITCFNAESGQRRWAVQIGLADNPISPLAYNDTYVFAPNGSKLFCLDKRNGHIIWELTFPGSPSVSPAVDDTRVYLGMIDGSIYTFDIKKITKLQEQGLMPRWSNETLMWRYKSSGRIISPPLPYQHEVVFASETGSVYAVGKIERDLIFQYKTAAKLSAPMARYKDSLLIPGQDNIFYAINIFNGSTKWEYTVGLPIYRTPVVVQKNVYFMPSRGGLYQLNAEAGTQNWWRPGIDHFIAASPTRVYSRDNMGTLIVLDQRDGSYLGAMRLTDYPKHLVNDVNDRVYLGTEGGLIVCLREPAREFPMMHQHPEKLPIMPLFAPAEGDNPAPAAKESPADASAPANESPGVEK